ncbi:MAG TPA: hypothetical protein VMH39_16495, partial [Gemmatimonadaceae bacterium]|nr:hypothetical protein [Gemmatimonadaceae bacterium]
MRVRTLLLAVAFVPAPGRAIAAQQPGLPPIHPVGPIVARLDVPVQSISRIRVLSTGAVLIDDPLGKQVLLVDSTLGRATPVIDTLGATARTYPRRAGALLPFVGDSSLYLDPIALAFLVIA